MDDGSCYAALGAERFSVVDVTSGLSSDAQGARMAFGAMALISDGFLRMIRTETNRGLEGRALAGFATGGKTFAFRRCQNQTRLSRSTQLKTEEGA